jgi:hypothetical protein
MLRTRCAFVGYASMSDDSKWYYGCNLIVFLDCIVHRQEHWGGTLLAEFGRHAAPPFKKRISSKAGSRINLAWIAAAEVTQLAILHSPGTAMRDYRPYVIGPDGHILDRFEF